DSSRSGRKPWGFSLWRMVAKPAPSALLQKSTWGLAAAVGNPPPLSLIPLSNRTYVRFAGRTTPVVTRADKPIRHDPSPANTHTLRSGRAMAKPTPTDSALPKIGRAHV